MNLDSKTLEYEKMLLGLLKFLKIILISRIMNTITLKAYLKNSYYEYELARSLQGRAAKIKTFILGFSYNSFQNVVRVLPTFTDWLRRLDPSLSNSVVAYKRDLFRNMVSENDRETLGVKNAFSYVYIARVRGFEPKKRF